MKIDLSIQSRRRREKTLHRRMAAGVPQAKEKQRLADVFGGG
jgi:hypothetical protein